LSSSSAPPPRPFFVERLGDRGEHDPVEPLQSDQDGIGADLGAALVVVHAASPWSAAVLVMSASIFS